MIYIEKNSLNDIYLTLENGKSNFLFEFIYDGYSSDPIYYTSNDISLYRNRYNHFILEDSDDISLNFWDDGYIDDNYVTSVLNLKNGQYTYIIYTTDESIDISNLGGLTSSSNIIETGRMVVSGIDTRINDIYN